MKKYRRSDNGKEIQRTLKKKTESLLNSQNESAIKLIIEPHILILRKTGISFCKENSNKADINKITIRYKCNCNQ